MEVLFLEVDMLKAGDTSRHWRYRAEVIRALADDIEDEGRKQIMFRIAANYDRLAEISEQHPSSAPQQK